MWCGIIHSLLILEFHVIYALIHSGRFSRFAVGLLDLIGLAFSVKTST